MTTKKKLKTLEEILQYCRDARSELERHEAEFFLRLVEVERDYGNLIKECGNLSFASWLKSSSLCESSRYVNFVKGLAHITPQKALELGAPAVMALAGVVNTDNTPVYIAAVQAFRAGHGGTVPTLETSQELLRKVDPRRSLPAGLRTASRIAELTAENQQLRADLRAARARIAALEAELAKRPPSPKGNGKRRPEPRAS